jgi:hypothetical protein
MEPREAACIEQMRAARRRIALAMDVVRYVRAELAETADENQLGVSLAFLDFHLASAAKALSFERRQGERIVKLRSGGSGE